MQVGGYDFPEINLALPAGAIMYPHIYVPDEVGYGARFNISFSAGLLPQTVVEDLAGNGVAKTGLARAKCGSAPRVMPNALKKGACSLWQPRQDA